MIFLLFLHIFVQIFFIFIIFCFQLRLYGILFFKYSTLFGIDLFFMSLVNHKLFCRHSHVIWSYGQQKEMFIRKTVAHSFPQSIHYIRSKCDSEAFIICTYAVLILFGAKMQSNSLVEFVVFLRTFIFPVCCCFQIPKQESLTFKKIYWTWHLLRTHLHLHSGNDSIVLLKKRGIERTLTTNVKKRQNIDRSEKNTIGRIECTALLFRQIPQEAFEFFAFL